jgi:hypothetical protein
LSSRKRRGLFGDRPIMSDLLDVLAQPPFQPVEQVGIAVVDDERDRATESSFLPTEDSLKPEAMCGIGPGP